jgi:hypothetical protein
VYKEFILAALLTSCGYGGYYFLTQSSLIKPFYSLLSKKDKPEIRMVIYQRGIGSLLYGVVPVVVMLSASSRSLSEYGISFEHIQASLGGMLAFAAVMLPIGILSGKRPSIQKTYPQIRLSCWNISWLTASAVTWLIYLSAYETLLRGFFFFSCWRVFGITAAIMINIAVYALFHIHKGTPEMLGSIFMGGLLCLSVYHSGNILPALTGHSLLALTTEWSAIHYNPKMTIEWRL